MAYGFSGSNGGVTTSYRNVPIHEIEKNGQRFFCKIPLEVSYFVNNTCNLQCRHCYVGYQNTSDSLTLHEWEKCFDELINMGARTFGNVGKEPLLDWNLTKSLLAFFHDKRSNFPSIRFGLVTNGTLLNKLILAELEELLPNYIDISMDGGKLIHDQIRGTGTFDRLVRSLSILKNSSLAPVVFISFTLNQKNEGNLCEVIDTIYRLGFKKILISPYITLNKNDDLYLSEEEIIVTINKLLQGHTIQFDNYHGLQIYIKNDYSAAKTLMDKMVQDGIIQTNELLLDKYGVIFNRNVFNDNEVFINYLPFDNSFLNAVRISHDGYISNCLDMFYKDYVSRTIGNVRNQNVCDMLEKTSKQILDGLPCFMKSVS